MTDQFFRKLASTAHNYLKKKNTKEGTLKKEVQLKNNMYMRVETRFQLVELVYHQLHRWYVGEREALVSFIRKICNPCVIKPWNKQNHSQYRKEKP